MGYLLNRRSAFRSTESGVFSSWSFDISKTVFDNLSKSMGSACSFMRLIEGGTRLVYITTGSTSRRIYTRVFDEEHPGEINYLADAVEYQSALISDLYAVGTDLTGKRWVAANGYPSTRIRGQIIDSAYDIASIVAFTDAGDTMPATALTGSSIALSADGTKVFYLGNDASRSFVQYTLETPFTVSSVRVGNVVVYMTAYATATTWKSFTFSPDGYRLIFVGANKVSVFDLSVPWDITTMTLTDTYTCAYTNLEGLCVNDDATKLYLSVSILNSIYQFSLNE